MACWDSGRQRVTLERLKEVMTIRHLDAFSAPFAEEPNESQLILEAVPKDVVRTILFLRPAWRLLGHTFERNGTLLAIPGELLALSIPTNNWLDPAISFCRIARRPRNE